MVKSRNRRSEILGFIKFILESNLIAKKTRKTKYNKFGIRFFDNEQKQISISTLFKLYQNEKANQKNQESNC